MKWVCLILVIFSLGCAASRQPSLRNFMATGTLALVYNTSKLTQIVIGQQAQIDSLIAVVGEQQLQIDTLKKYVTPLDTAHTFKIDSSGNVTLRDSLIFNGVLSVRGAVYVFTDSLPWHMHHDTIPDLPIDSNGIPLPIPVDTSQVPVIDSNNVPINSDPESWDDIRVRTTKRKQVKVKHTH